MYQRLGVPAKTMINTQAGLAEIELGRQQLSSASEKLATDLEKLDAGNVQRPWKYARARFTLARVLASVDSPASRIRGRRLAGEAQRVVLQDRTQDGLRLRIETWIEAFDRGAVPRESSIPKTSQKIAP
ncbi:MAG TPA: hypothetical protein ENK31_10200 [Nannocystis exedens]|nr:hypothetical protein [Nannocystis exedens]